MAVGVWDTKGLARDMPLSTFRDWQLFSKIEPFGGPWENWLMARQAYDFACANTEKNKRPKFEDYFYELPERKVERKGKQFIGFLRGLRKKQESKNG